MRGKKATPGEGAVRSFEQFAYTPTPEGTKHSWSGWCAAEPYWCKVHEHTKTDPGTKVCVQWFTDGALHCPRCKPHTIPSVVAYVPVWREVDLKACMVICHESVSDFLVGLGFGVRVVVGRADKGSSVFVKRAEVQSPWSSSLPYRKSAADITITLQTMWGYQHLNAWMADQEKLSRREREEKAKEPPVQSTGKPFSPEYRNAAIAAQELGEESAADIMQRILSRTKDREAKASRNGVHKPEG